MSRPPPIQRPGPAAPGGGGAPGEPQYVVTPPVRPRRRSERKNGSRKSRKLTRSRKSRKVLRGGGNCPQGGNHNCVSTGSRLSNVTRRCSKCGQAC